MPSQKLKCATGTLKTMANAAPVKKEQASQVNSGYYVFKTLFYCLIIHIFRPLYGDVILIAVNTWSTNKPIAMSTVTL
jgi:hypothetical protein